MRDSEALIVLELEEGMRVKGHPGLEVTPGAVACDHNDPSVLAVGEATCRVHSVVMRDDDLVNHLPPHPTYSRGLHRVIDLPYCLTHPMTTVSFSGILRCSCSAAFLLRRFCSAAPAPAPLVIRVAFVFGIMLLCRSAALLIRSGETVAMVVASNRGHPSWLWLLSATGFKVGTT